MILAELVKDLTMSGFKKETAEAIIYTLDTLLCRHLSSRSSSLPTREHLINSFDTQKSILTALRDSALSTEAANSAALRSDYDALAAAISRCRHEVSEEAQGVEGTIRLDINLERQRQADAFRGLEKKVIASGLHGKGGEGVLKVKNEMEEEAWRVKVVMAGFFGGIMGIILLLRI